MGLFSRLKKNVRRTPKTRRRRRLQAECLEDRRLLANLNFAASGQVIYGGGNGVDNNLSISVSGNTYTYTDTAETINFINAPGTTSGNGTNTVTFDATTAAVAINRLVVNTNAGNDVVSVSGIRGGAEGLEIRGTGSADTVNISGNLGTAGNRIGSYGVNIAASQINLGADIFTNNLDVILGAAMSGTPIALTASSEIDAGNATVEVNAGGVGISGATANLTIDGGSVQTRGPINLTGASDINLNAINLLQLGQAGATSEVTSGTGNVALSGGTQVALTDSVSSTGGSISITSPSSTMSNSAGAISGTGVTVSGALTNTTANTTDIDATAGDVSIGGNLASTAIVDVDASGNANFDGGVAATDIQVTAATVNATTFQASAGDVAVSGPTTFDGVGDVLVNSTGSVTFDNSITGNTSNLSLQAPTLVSVGGAITNVANLNVLGNGGALASAQLDSAESRNINVNATAIGLSSFLAANFAGGGSVNLTGAVTLNGAGINITSGGDAGESITITGAVNGSAVDSNALALNAGNFGDVAVTGSIGNLVRLDSLSARGDTVTLQAVNVANDLTVLGGNIRLQGAVTGGGTGTATFAPAVPGRTLDFFNNPAHTRVGVNTRITANTLSNIAGGAFDKFQFGDAATGIVRIHPNVDNSVPAGAMNLPTDTEFEAGAIIVSEDIQQNANTLTFETDNLAIYRVAAGTGDVEINKKTPGGVLELRGNLAANTNWGTNDITINAVGATVNAPAAGADLAVLGLTNQPQVNLGGPNASLTINADTLNALASSAIVSSGNLALNVDTIDLTGGVQNAGPGVVTLGNPGAMVENIGGGPFSILLQNGSDLTLRGFDGNGGSLNIRGVGGQLGTVSLGTISDTGALSLGTSSSNDATVLNVNGNITASSIVLRGDMINTGAMGVGVTLDSTDGNISLAGPVSVMRNTTLNNTSGLATGFVRIDGAIENAGVPAWSLDINAGVGSIVFAGAVGQGSALSSMTLVSGGINFLTVPITVEGAFSWTVGVTGNGVNDRIIRAGSGEITSNSGNVDLEADVLQGLTIGVNVKAPNGTVTLIERGAGD
ncbi:hypothetical protein RMSM_05194 [Rhodopirellula maiorica SM1]|uniref:Uncharacterized protein n=1 Tax=Rhodopirellula maiorica SM1 TaxID=1265738 RepID=M5REL7_9BACT|nr:hypothetical protein [Rhodopirellula maiorica]EMI17908.1 hypothetical protein RMSM_05194 [Rhodopirellula maiorica SM1]